MSSLSKRGADAWWIYEAEEILPTGTTCDACGAQAFPADIMDVWFDSGSNHAAVCGRRSELRWPADMYRRFRSAQRLVQSSLLTSVAAYRQRLLTATC